ncbi:MAG: hypothetical protein A2Z31_01920 [candidate division NC10 bacterium RBG_16_65_8]|nr:MAG: hypothetical protein A2Z31_01920 [candidate division NC10 bacterium RBG_16_65_8]
MRNALIYRFFWFSPICVLVAACAAGHLHEGTYVDTTKGLVVPLPREGWDIETGKEPDLVLRHRSRRAGILVNATCGDIPSGRPLDVAMRHLLFGIRGKEILLQERLAVTSGDGIEMVLRGRMEGQELLLHAYTLRRSECLYRLLLFSAPESYRAVNGEFESMVRHVAGAGELR